MSGPLNYTVQPYQTAQAVDSPEGLTCTFRAIMIAYSVTNINISGPAGTVSIYIGVKDAASLVDQTALGASNTATYPIPMVIPPGQQLFVVWNGTHAGTAQASIQCQSIPIGG